MTALTKNPKKLLRIVFVTAFVLCLPFIAMQFSDEVVWSIGDFIVAGSLLFGAGILYETIVAKNLNSGFRFAVAIAVLTLLLLVWLSLAVGPIGG